MTTQTSELPPIFEMASTEFIVVMAIFADSDSVYMDIVSELSLSATRQTEKQGKGGYFQKKLWCYESGGVRRMTGLIN